jgi:hypothetical protein
MFGRYFSGADSSIGNWNEWSNEAKSAVLSAGANFSRNDWRDSDFSRLRIVDVSFAGSLMDRSRFDGCELSCVDFSCCDLRDSVFTGARLSDCNFYAANLGCAELHNVNLTECQVMGAQFVHQFNTNSRQLHRYVEKLSLPTDFKEQILEAMQKHEFTFGRPINGRALNNLIAATFNLPFRAREIINELLRIEDVVSSADLQH